MNCITVCVDYSDYLALTLPVNRSHFEYYTVVTTSNDKDTKAVAIDNECLVFETNAFYENGAHFNKWLALEQGLDYMGRFNWLCVLDADIVLPRNTLSAVSELDTENLYVPRRRMYDGLPDQDQVRNAVVNENFWVNYPLDPCVKNFAGYCQIYYAESDLLKSLQNWYPVNWLHAGGGDTEFESIWPPNNKIRPDFEVLHLGPRGIDWCGRSSNRLDGSLPPNAGGNYNTLLELKRKRKFTGDYDHEKIDHQDEGRQ